MSLLLKKYGWVVYLFLIFILCYFMAKIASVVIAMKIYLPREIKASTLAVSRDNSIKVANLDDYRIIIDRNIFDSRDIESPVTTDDTPPQAFDPNAQAVKTSLSIKLIGTFSVGAGTDARSSATIASGEKVDNYSVDDGSNHEPDKATEKKSFAPGVRITKVLPQKVEFINGNRLEYVELEDFGGGLSTDKPISSLDTVPSKPEDGTGTPGIKETGQNKLTIEKALVDQAMSNLPALLREVAVDTSGNQAGLKLSRVSPNSLFSKLGLKRNDVLERINGEEVSMTKALELFAKLKDSKGISIDLVRGGQKMTLEYEIH